ncbi:MAG: hypothetical protein Q4D91_12370 [Lautropia sp.]|nr:hypothetical protein [Lautropia sp.]
MKNFKKLGVGAAALVAALGLASVAPTEAQAQSCSGNLIKSFPINSPKNGEQIGALDVYYSKRNGGTNTACMRHHNKTWGEGLETRVAIQRCDGYYDCDTAGPWKNDGGHYKYYAGPVFVSGTRKNCVAVRGVFEDRYSDERVYIHAWNLGCGATPQVTYPSPRSDTRCRPHMRCPQ